MSIEYRVSVDGPRRLLTRKPVPVGIYVVADDRVRAAMVEERIAALNTPPQRRAIGEP